MFEMTSVAKEDNHHTAAEWNDTERGLVYDSERIQHVTDEQTTSAGESPFLAIDQILLLTMYVHIL